MENTAQLATADLMELEEIWLEPTTSVELRVGETADSKPIWRGLDHLSTGQKATAILLILLLDSTACAPLVVDQPEDDLDNAFIADDVVPRFALISTRGNSSSQHTTPTSRSSVMRNR